MKLPTVDDLQQARERSQQRRAATGKALAAHATQVRVERAKKKNDVKNEVKETWRCGHPRTPENTYTTQKNKWECCYECKRKRWLEHEAQKDTRDVKPLLEQVWR